MWITLAVISAVLLGFYDAAKKRAVAGNDVLTVLFWSTVVSALLFMPVIIASLSGADWFAGSRFAIAAGSAEMHIKVAIKSVIVISSWIAGYYGLKYLPLTLVGPMNATRPVIVLVASIALFGERLNLWQWAGVAVSVASVWLLGRSSRKEGIDFTHNRWIVCMVLGVLLGAASAVYDRYILRQIDPIFVQSWFNVYDVVLMAIVLAATGSKRQSSRATFRWNWAIPLISIFVSAADFCYFYSLSMPDSMLSVVAMIRRSSVIVSFGCGALIFHEGNLRSKAVDLGLLLVGMALLLAGSY